MEERSTSLTFNLRYLPLLAAVFGTAYFLSADRPWLVLGVGLAALWALCYVWARELERSLRVERLVDYVWASIGDFIRGSLRIVNDGRLPATWVEVVDRSEMMPEPFNMVSSVSARSPTTCSFDHPCNRRGLFSLGPTTLRAGDPFGLFTVTVHDPRANMVMITPPILPLDDVRVPSGGWGGDENRRRSVLERSISDAGARPYLPGDSLRRIHWPATARHDELIVRDLEAATSGDWWLIADLNGAVQAGQGRDSTLELVVVLAASLAERGLREGRRVGLSLMGPGLSWLEPSSSADQRWRIIRTLSAARAGERPLHELLRLANPIAGRVATFVVITPDSDPGWVAVLRDRTPSGQSLAVLVESGGFGVDRDLRAVSSLLNRSRIEHIHYGRPTLDAAYQAGTRSEPETFGGGRKLLRKGGTAWKVLR